MILHVTLLIIFAVDSLSAPVPPVPTPRGVLASCGSYFELSSFFSNNTNSHYLSHGSGGCQGCTAGEGYKLLRGEGFAYSSACPECTNLVTYYSKTRDINLVATRVVTVPSDFSPWPGNAAWVLPLNYSGNAITQTLELWKLGESDYWTLASPSSRAEAQARNYTLLAPLGLLLVDAKDPSNPPPPPPLYTLEMAVEGFTSFRLSAALFSSPAPPQQLQTPMVAPKSQNANFTTGGVMEVFLDAPTLGYLVLQTTTCALEVQDASRTLIAHSPELFDSAASSSNSLTFSLETLSSATVQDSRPTRFTGAGTDGEGSTTLSRTSAIPYVGNTVCFTPTFWCSDGYSALAVSPKLLSQKPSIYGSPYPAQWEVSPSGGAVGISIQGGSADLYLSPAPSLRQHCSVQSALVGQPALLPRYAHGFMANRWGWTNQSYIESVLQQFRSGGFPADVFIVDFEVGVQAAVLPVPLAKNIHPSFPPHTSPFTPPHPPHFTDDLPQTTHALLHAAFL